MTHLQKQTFLCTLPIFQLRPFKTRGTVVARTTQDEMDIADKTTKTRTTQTCQALFGRMDLVKSNADKFQSFPTPQRPLHDADRTRTS